MESENTLGYIILMIVTLLINHGGSLVVLLEKSWCCFSPTHFLHQQMKKRLDQ